MINICICDNDDKNKQELYRAISLYFSGHSYEYKVYDFQDGEALVLYCQKNHGVIDILFIDTDLPKMSGLEAAKTVRKLDDNMSIVINANSKSNALKAYEVWPLYYNVKPMKYEVLKKILDRYFQQSGIKEQKLVVKIGKKYISLFYDEITYIESRNTAIIIHMNNLEELNTYGKLDEIEKTIGNKRFLRCHKSFLINMDYIKSTEGYKFKTIFGDFVSIKQREASKIKNEYYEYVKAKEENEI